MRKREQNAVTLPDAKPHKLNRRDCVVLSVLCVIYALTTFLNLGTLRFPTTVFYGETDASVTVEFPYTAWVDTVWFNGNIAEGTLRLTGDTGDAQTYEQLHGNMFRWHEASLPLQTRTLTLTVAAGEIYLNEIAFFDPDGNLLAASVVEPTGTAACLLDEQNDVPDTPSYFNGMYFDEIYHARTAYENIHNLSIYEWTHPPLGKILISLGIRIFGMTPFGWRFMGALFGLLMLPVLYLFGKRIFRRMDFAFLTAALFAVDTMHFTQTRIATIDVFALFFILLMYFYMYEFLRRDYRETPFRQLMRPLGLCGLFFGLGVSSKWIGCYAGAGLAVLLFGFLIAEGARAYRTQKGKEIKAYWRRTASTLGMCCVFFLAVPALTYFLSYIPYYRYEAKTREGVYTLEKCIARLIRNQKDMYRYHSGLTEGHLCQSTWYQWPFTAKSVWFYFEKVGERYSNISSIGNPAVWWTSTIGALGLLVERALGRVKRATILPVLLVAIVANYLPWVLVPRCVFLYHFFATIPFVMIAALYLVYTLETQNPRLGWIKWAWLGLATLFFALMYPAVSGVPTSAAYAYFIEHILPGGWMYYGWI